jgi:pilus assembly protein Flp/PilA
MRVRIGAAGVPGAMSKETEMLAFLNNLRALAKDERGVTALEYGVIAGLLAVVIVTSVPDFGTRLATVFTAITADLL